MLHLLWSLRSGLLPAAFLDEPAWPFSSIGPHVRSSSSLKLRGHPLRSLEVAADALCQERFNKRVQCLRGFGDTYVCLFEFGPKVDSSNIAVIEARSSKVQHDTYRKKHIYAKLTMAAASEIRILEQFASNML